MVHLSNIYILILSMSHLNCLYPIKSTYVTFEFTICTLDRKELYQHGRAKHSQTLYRRPEQDTSAASSTRGPKKEQQASIYEIPIVTRDTEVINILTYSLPHGSSQKRCFGEFIPTF